MTAETLIAEAVKAERQRCIQAALSAFAPHYMAEGTVRNIVEKIDPSAVGQVDEIAERRRQFLSQMPPPQIYLIDNVDASTGGSQ